MYWSWIEVDSRMYFRTTAGENRKGKKEASFGDDCGGKRDGDDKDGEDGKKYGTLELRVRYPSTSTSSFRLINKPKSEVARFMKKCCLAIKSRAPKPEVPRHDDHRFLPIRLRHPGEIRGHLSRHALVRSVRYHRAPVFTSVVLVRTARREYSVLTSYRD